MEAGEVTKRGRGSVITVTPHVLDPLRLALAVVQSIVNVKFQFSILIEDQCATSGETHLLLGRHILRWCDFQFPQFGGLQLENLHVLGNGLAKRKPIWSNS